jgi:hypothetical protein
MAATPGAAACRLKTGIRAVGAEAIPFSMNKGNLVLRFLGIHSGGNYMSLSEDEEVGA